MSSKHTYFFFFFSRSVQLQYFMKHNAHVIPHTGGEQNTNTQWQLAVERKDY